MPSQYRLDHVPGNNKVEAHPASMTKKVGKPKNWADTLGRGQESLFSSHLSCPVSFRTSGSYAPIQTWRGI